MKMPCPFCNKGKKKTQKNLVLMPYIVGKGWICLQCGNTNPYVKTGKNKSKGKKNGEEIDRSEQDY
jgi:C4-type Zn-finger protein